MSDRDPDDDADTPRYPTHAREESGEIDVPPPPRRKPRRGYTMSDNERALSGFRARDTGPMNVPEPRDLDDVTPPMGTLSPELQLVVDAVMSRMDRLHRSTANRVLEVEAAAVASPKLEPAKKTLAAWLAEKAIAGVIGIVLAVVADGYRSARAELASQHDQLITLEQRMAQSERVLGAIVVPRILPNVIVPITGKEP